MTFTRLVFLAVLLMGFAAFAHADGLPVDPQMIVSDPPCVESCGTAVGTTFSFMSDTNGGGFFTFQNVSEENWSSLLITTGSDPFNVPAASVTCSTNAFLSCQASDLAGGITAMFLSGLNTDIHGILIFDSFTINLNDDGPTDVSPTGSGGWSNVGGDVRTFDASANVANPVPEPATLTLMGAGLGALLAKKKFRSRAHSHS